MLLLVTTLAHSSGLSYRRKHSAATTLSAVIPLLKVNLLSDVYKVQLISRIQIFCEDCSIQILHPDLPHTPTCRYKGLLS